MESARADGSRPRRTRWMWWRERRRSTTSRTWSSRQAARSCATAGSTGRAPRLQGRTRMTRAEEFEELRPLLFAIAYRILGSVAEAEDAVQETWLRYESSPTSPTSTKAFLSAVVTRVSIDVLRSARVRRETYVGQW